MIGKRGKVKILIAIVAAAILILLVALIFFSFIYSKKVNNQSDFNKQLYNCDKTTYLSDQASAVWQYKIFGKDDGACRVDVTLISAKQGASDVKELEGLDMTCSLPLGSISSPESNLKLCHGLLKEGIQELIIERMHAYVTTNLDVLNGVA